MTTAQEHLFKLLSLEYPVEEYGLVEIRRDPDGMYWGCNREGKWNISLGRPKPTHIGPALDNVYDVWNTLTSAERDAVIALAQNPKYGTPIPLREEFGVPIPSIIPSTVQEKKQ